MRRWRELATKTAKQAARTRAALGIDPTFSVCPFDIAGQLGLVVRLAAVASLEGMYSPGPRRTVVLGTERPWGRIRHTCGHEIGHDVFGHGTRVDELCEGPRRAWSPEEYLADRFSTGLLMPKLAVADALRRRGWEARTLTTVQVFTLAQDFGVGYSSFVSHAEGTLKIIPSFVADELRRQGRRLGPVRNAVAGMPVAEDVFVVDEHWGARPLDLETGDVVVIPPGALFSGRCARLSHDPAAHLVAVDAGEGQLRLRRRRSAINVRVSRRGFTGLARYRYLAEAEDE